MGGIVWGVKFALHKEGHLDHVYGSVNNNLAEYHVTVNRDIGDIDVTVLEIPDTRVNLFCARGIDDIGITSAALAVANAIYNATANASANIRPSS